ncbi:MAG: DUF4167 domain-containing protein [Hyphomicrobiaceae bacterium]|nr:DUF4167 domain-containing protein [Hyphomicrobiaceae bacterium]
MRPNQQSKRSRGRGNNGRKNTNPLSRSYESNGPDVRIRGNAQTIAEKYAQLARDAMSAGDSVGAENYLQHAEHYNRIILAAQAQQQQRFESYGEQRSEFSGDDDEDEGEGFAGESNGAPAESVSADADDAADEGENEGDGERQAAPAPRRDRRPRRRPRSDNGGEQAGGQADPSKAPQPSLSDLPAFLTNGADAPAE